MKTYVLVPETHAYYNLTKGWMYIIEKIDNQALYFTDDNKNMTFVAIDEFPKSFKLLTF